MPKLSRYIHADKSSGVEKGVSLVFHEKLRPDEFLAGPSAATLKSSHGASMGQISPAGGDPIESTDARSVRPSEGGAGRRDRLQTVWERRSQTYGPRQYRQSDGSMSATRPPRNPYAVASRSSWNDLVRYCRQESSGSQATAAIQRVRYGGDDVSYGEHAAFLKSLGDMSPELGDDGGFVGFEEGRTRPLDDGEHAFNSYFARQAEEVFRQCGRQ